MVTVQQLENSEIERVEESWHAFSKIWKELARTFALFSVKLKELKKNFRVMLDFGEVTLCVLVDISVNVGAM